VSRPVRTLAVAATGALLLAAAGSVAAPPWQPHALARGGSIALPATWYDFTRNTRHAQAALNREVERNPRIAPLLHALAARRSPLVRFLGADLAPRSLRRGFVTNVSLLAQRTTATLDRWAASNVTALRRIPTVVEPIRRSTVRLPAGRAVHLRYQQRVQTGTPVKRVAIAQYAVTRNRRIYLLTFTTLPRQVAAYRATFLQSARSLRLR
jgi:hypothetical protein